MSALNLLSPAICREAMRRFWEDQTQVAGTANGVAMALPLMYPDGWQVQVFLEPVSAKRAVITDKGQTLMRLHEQGLNCEGGQTAVLLAERKSTFALEQDGYELLREIPLPLDGIDVQMFAEALGSIAHLLYRLEPSRPLEHAADRVLQQVFKERQLQPKLNFAIDGRIERRIHVDYYLDTVVPVALQVVRRRAPILPYMEQWGFRWADIQQRHARTLRAMVYDPDKQEWDDTALSIGRQVCDLFCPYFETQAVNELLSRAAAGR